MKPRHTAEQSTVRVNKATAMGSKGFSSVASSMVGKKTAFQEPLQKSLDIADAAPLRSPEPVMMKRPHTAVVFEKETEQKTEQKLEQKSASYQSLSDLAKKTDSPKEKSVRRVIKTDNKTCPTDPAELAQCDSCQ